MERIKAVFNWSGGKDSAHALLRAMQSGKYEIVALLTTVNRDTHRSTMHGIPTALLQAQADSIGIPLHIVDLTPKGNMEDYGAAMSHAVEHFKAQGVTCFIFGDIFLHDVRKYREQKLAPHGIGIAEPLWGKSSSDVMHDFLASGLRTVIVTTMADSLGADAVGREIDPAFIASLPAGGKYEIVALLTTVNRDTHRSTMHGIPTALLQAQADSIGIPLHIVDLTPKGNMEDYGAAMSHAVEHFKAQGVTCFIFGDIFLHDVRKYRERQLAPHGIGVAEPLWGESSGGVMHDFLASGLRTVIVTTMADSLGADAVGREIDPAFMASLPAGVDPNGENGEYHTFCYDGPIFRTPVPFRLGTPLRRSYRIRLDDGSEKSYSYWFADLQQA
ncbi:hypothetical protein F2S32_08785 [Alistipes onderdonkii]|nr:hypothetical protein F2S32_08785 [Alistipes onderdonkii]